MSILNKLREQLLLPEVKDLNDLDTPDATSLHARIIAEKYYLKKIYLDWYKRVKKSLPLDLSEKVLIEIGSGGGFIKEVLPQVKTTETIPIPGADLLFSAVSLPFPPGSVDAFILIDVFHHIHDVKSFLKEAEKCLKHRGRIVMIEPANTAWSRFVFKHSHHEPFNLEGDWSFAPGGRMTSANGALPWIVFFRDRKIFKNRFPDLKIRELKPFMPFAYLISGGVSMRQILPSFTYWLVKGVEKLLTPLNNYLGMFLFILLEKFSEKGGKGE